MCSFWFPGVGLVGGGVVLVTACVNLKVGRLWWFRRRHRIFVLVVTSLFVFFPMHNKFLLLLLLLQLNTCYKKTYFVEQFCFIFITRYFSTIITFHIWESCLTLRLTVRVCFRISLGTLCYFFFIVSEWALRISDFSSITCWNIFQTRIKSIVPWRTMHTGRI